MSDSPLRMRETASRFCRAWEAFFLGPQDLRLVGIVRIGFAALLLVNYLTWWPRLELWFGESGIMPQAVAVELDDPYSFSLFNWLPTTKGVLYSCYAIAVCQAALLLVGVWPRIQALGSLMWLLSYQSRNPIIWDSEDTLMRLICFYLILMPLDQVWAVRFPWRVTRPESVGNDPPQGPAWGLRLLQLQIALIVWVAGTSKLYGRPWVEGDALYYVARLHEFFPRFPVPGFLFDTPWIVKPMTWLVIVVELMVPILVWFKETRRFALLLALTFHLASDYSMNLFLFHWLMITGWAAFLTTDDLNAMKQLIRPAANK